jgi:hypothetical protein
MLEVLARHFPMKVTRAQLGTLANYASSGGTFGTYLGTLKRHGYIAEPSRGEVTITPAGLAHLGISVRPEPQSSEAFIKMWLEALRLGERKMLTALISAYPSSLSRDGTGTQVDMAPSEPLGHIWARCDERSGGSWGDRFAPAPFSSIVKGNDPGHAAPLLFFSNVGPLSPCGGNVSVCPLRAGQSLASLFESPMVPRFPHNGLDPDVYSAK